ncbi:MAG: hypothetical protein IH605_18265 [Burkholderiales bacterium]|nr:hypothetical protein [Burkholderiales bacterium]
MRTGAAQRYAGGSMRALVATIGKGLCLGLSAASFFPGHAAAVEDAVQLSKLARPSSAAAGSTQSVAAAPFTIATQALAANSPKRANFERERASRASRHVADWVVDSGDNHGMPFAIVDKTDAKVFVFDALGRLRGAAPALLGLARGDDAVPGIGDRALSSISPGERTTPAGRFVAALGMNAHGQDILWVDYNSAVSMHRVITTKPKERRLQRLATATPLDNRISYGCINVPAKFYENVVRPAFTGTNGIVYVLPETRSTREVFASYDVDEHARLKSASQAVSAQVTAAAVGR